MPVERTCEVCGKEFSVRPYVVKIGKGKYCSRKCYYQSLIGTFIRSGKDHRNWGKTIPKEVREKISNSLMGEKNPNYGKTFSKEHRRKIGDANRGEKSGSWKGGITDRNHQLRNSDEYRKWRLGVYKRDHYTCQMCGEKLTKGLNAHHILSFAEFPQWMFEQDNGVTFCDDCHEIIHILGGQFCPLPAFV